MVLIDDGSERYMHGVGQSEDWMGLHVALSPRLIGYGTIARMLDDDPNTKRDGNSYLSCVENCLSDDYAADVRAGSGTYLLPPVDTDMTRDTKSRNRTAGEPRRPTVTDKNRRICQDLHPRNKGETQKKLEPVDRVGAKLTTFCLTTRWKWVSGRSTVTANSRGLGGDW